MARRTSAFNECLVLEQRLRTGQRRGQADEAVTAPVEHAPQPGDEIGFATRGAPAEHEQGDVALEQLLKRPVREIDQVPDRRCRLEAAPRRS